MQYQYTVLVQEDHRTQCVTVRVMRTVFHGGISWKYKFKILYNTGYTCGLIYQYNRCQDHQIFFGTNISLLYQYSYRTAVPYICSLALITGISYQVVHLYPLIYKICFLHLLASKRVFPTRTPSYKY